MAQTAIIHTATRVIRRLTTEVAPTLAADESAVTPAEMVDLATNGGLLKLDGAGHPVACTLAELRQAGLDESQAAATRVQLRADLIASCDTLLADATIANPRIKQFVTAVKALLS